ncbi:ABC transporter permease [Streptomyces sp900116325]|uniref:ABC transporter permease n=1 Tax=Streptomyces sp. 900116325 TaxID=3154295 RepID=UPI0033C1812B
MADASRVTRAESSRDLAGTGALVRLALRRDRIVLPVWVLLISAMVLSNPNTIKTLYNTSAERADLAQSLATNASLRATYGPVFSDSLGGLTTWRIGVYASILAAVMSLIIVVRHTRDEEETGRQELISSAMVGRRAPLTAALLTALIGNGLMALLITAGLAGQGTSGALALGLATAGVGMVFATMAAITAQLTESGRLAKGLTAALLGAAFVLRAAGDSATNDGSSVLTWISPIGWLENLRAFADERWWVLLVFGAAIAAQGFVAYELAGRRDIGMSFLPSRPGSAEGRIATAGGLAWRLQRGSVLGWSLGFLVAGLAFGGLIDGASDLVGDNVNTREIIERMGGQATLADAFVTTMVGLLGMVASLYIVASVLRLHGEETSQRAEPILANAVGRLAWAGGHLVIAFGGAALIMMIGGLGLFAGYGQDLGPILGACLVQLPAIWVLGALAVLLHGVWSRAAVASWAVAGLALLLGWIGPALNLPQAAMNLSPFGHLPKLPGDDMQWAPVLTLTVIAVVMVAVGLAALRRRDMAA